jgi:hypothetical protein
VIDAVGVYVIWHEGNPSRVVRVGHGRISECLHYHQEDPEVLTYGRYGTLRVTWAAVPPNQLEGVARYLAEHWRPLVADRPLKVLPIAVNSPFGRQTLRRRRGSLRAFHEVSCIDTKPKGVQPPLQACR